MEFGERCVPPPVFAVIWDEFCFNAPEYLPLRRVLTPTPTLTLPEGALPGEIREKQKRVAMKCSPTTKINVQKIPRFPYCFQ